MKIKLVVLICVILFSCTPKTKYTIKDKNGKSYYADEIYYWDKHNCITFWGLDLNGIGKKTKICDCYIVSEK